MSEVGKARGAVITCAARTHGVESRRSPAALQTRQARKDRASAQLEACSRSVNALRQQPSKRGASGGGQCAYLNLGSFVRRSRFHGAYLPKCRDEQSLCRSTTHSMLLLPLCCRLAPGRWGKLAGVLSGFNISSSRNIDVPPQPHQVLKPSTQHSPAAKIMSDFDRGERWISSPFYF